MSCTSIVCSFLESSFHRHRTVSIPSALFLVPPIVATEAPLVYRIAPMNILFEFQMCSFAMLSQMVLGESVLKDAERS